MERPKFSKETIMSQVAVTKVNSAGKKKSLVFKEMAKRMEEVQARAFDLFEQRSRELGHEWEDWLKAEAELLGSATSELAEQDGAYQFQITLPGFEPKDIEVTASPNEVIVHAAKRQQKKTEKGNVVRTESGSNEVYRSFGTPNSVNVDKVTANLENGILRIHAPEITNRQEIKTVAA
jgi:HSP20 family protein